MTPGSSGTALFSVLGIGNVIMGDDGLGPHLVARFLARYEVPETLEVVDVGTPGPELVHRVAGRKGVVILDALQNRGDPGRVHRVNRRQIVGGRRATSASPHDPFLRSAILTAEFVGNDPEHIVLLGAQVLRVEPSTELSAIARAALPALEVLLVAELIEMGLAIRRRQHEEPGRHMRPGSSPTVLASASEARAP